MNNRIRQKRNSRMEIRVRLARMKESMENIMTNWQRMDDRDWYLN